jgi:transposase InsO family protein
MLPLPNYISDIHFSKLELMRMHNGFHNPSAGKLYRILQRAKPTEVPPHLLSVLEDISKYCETGQRTARKPLRFQATIPRDLGFGEELQLDLMWLDGKYVLHVTDVATKYSSASFLENESAVSVWKALTLCWTTFFPGFPRIFHSDSGSQFTSAKWKE